MTIEKINEIIDKELEYAREVNPIMAMGMIQIKMILNQEARKENEV